MKQLFRKSVATPLRKLASERNRLLLTRSEIEHELAQLRDERARIRQEQREIRQERAELVQERKDLRAERLELQKETSELRQQHAAVGAERTQLDAQLLAERLIAPKLALARRLTGRGIEIGAFDKPLPVAPGVLVRYVDRFTTEQLRQMYPQFNAVPVDIVDEGETLSAIESDSQDFLIASHFLEHCQNPIGAIANMLRVVRVGGRILLVIPDKDYTFDVVRDRTPFAHLLRDYAEGPSVSQREHCEEWALRIDKLEDPVEREAKVQHLIDTDWPIHYHVWNAADILELFTEARKLDGIDFAIDAFYSDANFEATVLLYRTA